MARVLVVDDEELARYTVRGILESGGHQVSEARSGEEAIEICLSQTPDVIIMDIIMPGMGGLQAIRELKSKLPRMKIIAISGGARSDAADPLEKAREMGANYILAKPFSPEGLTKCVLACLNNGAAY